MEQDVSIVTLTKKDMIRLEMIIVDNDKDEALAFLRALRSKIGSATIKGMKSHLDK